MSILDWIFCMVIAFLAIYVFIMLFYFSYKFDNVMNKFTNIILTRSSYVERVEVNGIIKTQGLSENTINQAELEKNREDYYTKYASYVVISQIISLFPLLGILGTVWGLVMGGIDADKLLEGLSFALITTFIGLLASILLKLVDSIFVGKKINLIDAEFERADAIISRQSILSEIRKATNMMR